MVFGWSFSGHQTQDAQAYHWCELSKERAPQVSPFCYSPGRSRGSLAVVWQEEMLTSLTCYSPGGNFQRYINSKLWASHAW